MLEILKLIVQPVLLERDDSGAIVGEKSIDPLSVYTKDEYFLLYKKLMEGITDANSEPKKDVERSEPPETL